MPFLQLDLDVIHAILSHIEPNDALPLALTCTSVHEAAMRRRLTRVDIRTCTKEALDSFCRCIARNGLRPQYLNSINIASWPKPRPSQDNRDREDPPGLETMVRLSHTISQTTRLSRLEWDQGMIVDLPPHCLLDAVTGIRTLTVVKFSLSCSVVCEVLSRMESHPHTIMCKPTDTAAGSWNLHQVISRFADAGSLHTISLEVQQAITLHTAGGHSRDVVPWSSVKNLTIHRSFSVDGSASVDLPLLSRAFPGVERLRLFGDARCFTAEPFAWPSVNFLHTTFPVRLTTAVRHVIIESPYESPPHGGSTGILDRLRPSVLECEAGQYSVLDVVRSGHSIKFLQLHVRGARQYDDASSVYTSIMNYVKELQTVPVPLRVNGLAVMAWSGLQDAGRTMALDVCTRLATLVPSLQYVGMVWYARTYVPLEPGLEIVSSIWYEIPPHLETALEPTLVRLSEREGDTVFAELLASSG